MVQHSPRQRPDDGERTPPAIPQHESTQHCDQKGASCHGFERETLSDTAIHAAFGSNVLTDFGQKATLEDKGKPSAQSPTKSFCAPRSMEAKAMSKKSRRYKIHSLRLPYTHPQAKETSLELQRRYSFPSDVACQLSCAVNRELKENHQEQNAVSSTQNQAENSPIATSLTSSSVRLVTQPCEDGGVDNQNQLHPGAVYEEGIDSGIASNILQHNSSASLPEIVVAAEVAPTEQEIEAQVQARLYDEMEEVAAQAQMRILDEAVVADVVEEDKSQHWRCKILLFGLLASVVVIIATSITLTVGKNGNTECTFFCSGGSFPEQQGEMSFILDGENITCADFSMSQKELDATDDLCKQGQAIAWRYCGCTTLPPFPEHAKCTLSMNGSLPIQDLERLALENRTCTDWDTYVALLGSHQSDECAALMVEFAEVAYFCASDMVVVSSLENLLHPISGDVIYEEGSPQHTALYWLATHPAGLAAEEDQNKLRQRYILATLYFATGGPFWGESYGFLSDESICSWNDGLETGIFCNGIDVVDKISLPMNNLNGILPNELTVLTDLLNLDIWGNTISGSIPKNIGNLSSLQVLDMETNSLTGTIPDSVFNIATLHFLCLSHNAFSPKPLPSTVAHSLALEQFFCANCSLTGTLPVSIGDLSHLTNLELVSNKLTGTLPDSIGMMSELADLILGTNSFTGTVPSVIAKLSQLVRLDLGENQFKGTISLAIESLSNLEVLGLANNMLTGSIPTWLGKIKKLKGLWLKDNDLTGKIPSELGQLEQLLMLGINGNRLSGTVPAELGSCSLLRELYLSRCGLSGLFPSSIANLPDLNFLWIDGNNFTNDFQDTFCTRETPIEDLMASCLREDIDCPCCQYCCDSQGINCTSMGV